MATKHKRATMTARQLAEDYLAHQITRDVTRTSTRHHLNQLLAMFGGWQARRVGAAQMQEFLTAQKARGVMATTAHHRVRLWRTVLAWAVETGRLPASPLAGFRLHRPRARPMLAHCPRRRAAHGVHGLEATPGIERRRTGCGLEMAGHRPVGQAERTPADRQVPAAMRVCAVRRQGPFCRPYAGLSAGRVRLPRDILEKSAPDQQACGADCGLAGRDASRGDSA